MDYFVGRKSLQAGLAMYVSKFAYKNTGLDDLVQCLNESVRAEGTHDVDFGAWTDDWLKKSGVNTLQLETTEFG